MASYMAQPDKQAIPAPPPNPGVCTVGFFCDVLFVPSSAILFCYTTDVSLNAGIAITELSESPEHSPGLSRHLYSHSKIEDLFLKWAVEIARTWHCIPAQHRLTRVTSRGEEGYVCLNVVYINTHK